jgi:hypothetical protein
MVKMKRLNSVKFVRTEGKNRAEVYEVELINYILENENKFNVYSNALNVSKWAMDEKEALKIFDDLLSLTKKTLRSRKINNDFEMENKNVIS